MQTLKQAFKWLLVTSILSFGLAMAQSEPTLNQVYATAQAGKLDQAQLMIQQVLISHPNSAKAFFVRAELYARQGDLTRASEALATAEKFAPGLPFAKPEAVQALRTQLAAKKSTAVSGSNTGSAVPMAIATAPGNPGPSSTSWALPLLLAGGVIGLGYFLFRKKKPDPYFQQPGFANQGGLSGPQTFGSTMGGAPYGQPVYANQGGMQAPYGQPTGTGLGGRIMGGVATGLAVGAGVMAAEAIGRNLMGGHNTPAPAATTDSFTNDAFQPIDQNRDMGGQDFGINDTSSWDDGGSMDVGGGGGWDN
jgi:PAB1-binding protein PBP1